MKHLLAIAAVTLAAGGAQAQSGGAMGSIPSGFEIYGDIDVTYAFDNSGNSTVGFGKLGLGYRYDISSDLAIGAGVRAVSVFGDFDSETEYGFYAYVDYRDFRLSYGAIDNAAARFDWDFVAFENTYLGVFLPFNVPIGINAQFAFIDDIIRVDARFGNFDLSASYSDEAEIGTIAGQTEFGNLRLLAAIDFWLGGGGSDEKIVTFGANYTLNAFEFGAVIGIPSSSAPFDSITRIAATYHINDNLSVKAVYAPESIIRIDIWEVSATYDVTDIFSIGVSAGEGIFGSGTFFGITASAHF